VSFATLHVSSSFSSFLRESGMHGKKRENERDGVSPFCFAIAHWLGKSERRVPVLKGEFVAASRTKSLRPSSAYRPKKWPRMLKSWCRTGYCPCKAFCPASLSLLDVGHSSPDPLL
jgi:hypothetical protein